jgi:hypothetical protein
MAVEDVQMYKVQAGGLQAGDLVAQTRVVTVV